MRIIRQEVTKQLQPVLKQYVSGRNAITGGFKNKPEWEAKANIRDNGIQIVILLKNSGRRVSGGVTMATLLKWLFETGTRAHVIRAKRGYLAFMTGYSRITPLSGGRGSGKATGALLFRKVVNHPGFAPSPAIDKLDKRLEKPLRDSIGRGYRIGHNRAKK